MCVGVGVVCFGAEVSYAVKFCESSSCVTCVHFIHLVEFRSDGSIQ